MENLNEVMKTYNTVKDLENALTEAKNKLSQQLEPVVQELGTQFTHGDKKYQIRKRGDRYYLCEIKKKPGRKKVNKEEENNG